MYVGNDAVSTSAGAVKSEPGKGESQSSGNERVTSADAWPSPTGTVQMHFRAAAQGGAEAGAFVHHSHPP